MEKPTDYTDAQWEALKKVYARAPMDMSFEAFAETAYHSLMVGCVMVPWCGMCAASCG